jgi:hypothetical protein
MVRGHPPGLGILVIPGNLLAFQNLNKNQAALKKHLNNLRRFQGFQKLENNSFVLFIPEKEKTGRKKW